MTDLPYPQGIQSVCVRTCALGEYNGILPPTEGGACPRPRDEGGACPGPRDEGGDEGSARGRGAVRTRRGGRGEAGGRSARTRTRRARTIGRPPARGGTAPPRAERLLRDIPVRYRG
jgi:hypothetical protein